MAKPINVVGTALYNYTEGYGSYLIPAVMMIIIFQTLLMVIGMLTGDEHTNRGIRAYTPFGYAGGVASFGDGKTLYIVPYMQSFLFSY